MWFLGADLLPLKLIGGFKMVSQLTSQALTLRRAVMSSQTLFVGAISTRHGVHCLHLHCMRVAQAIERQPRITTAGIISGETYGVRKRRATDDDWSPLDLVLLDEAADGDAGAPAPAPMGMSMY